VTSFSLMFSGLGVGAEVTITLIRT